MIECPAPDTDLEIDSLDVLGENPSAWRKCGDTNGETRPKEVILVPNRRLWPWVVSNLVKSPYR